MKNYLQRSLISVILILIGFAPTLFAQPKLINLDFKTTEIQDVLRAMASQEEVNIVIDKDVSGIITIQLHKVTFEQALQLITGNNDLTYTKTGNLYRIASVDHSVLKLEYTAGLVSLEAREVKLDRLIRELAQKTGANLVPAPELQDKITLSVTKVAWPDALQALLTQANCMVETVGKVGFVRKKTTPAIPCTVNFDNDRLTVDAKNVPIEALCRVITEKTGVAVVPDQGLSINASIFLQNVLLDEGLSVLCETNGLQLYRDGQIRRIAKKNGGYRIVVKDGQLSVDAENVAIAVIVNEISKQSGITIALDRDVRANVTAHFQKLSLAQGLIMLTENQGWAVDKQANKYYIRPNLSPSKNIRIVYNPDNGLYNLDIQDAPIALVISEMARRANIDLVISGQINDSVTNIRLQQLKFTDALDYLFKGTNLFYKKDGDVYLIWNGSQVRPENKDFNEVKVYPIKYVKAEQLLNALPATLPKQNFTQMAEKNALILTAAREIHDLFASYLAQVDVPSIEDRTEVVKVKYLKAEDMLKLIPPALKTDMMVVTASNAIAVTGPQNVVSQVKSYIEKLDQVNPLIIFEISVIQISDTNSTDWEAPSGVITLNGKELSVSASDGGITLNKAGTNTSDALVSLTALISKGLAKVVAHPTITALNGCKASFDVCTKYNYNVASSVTDDTTTYTTKTYDSGLYFTITPWVSMDKQITMEIKPKLSEFGDSPTGSTLPSTTEREVETTVRVTDGQTVIISGLMNTRTEVSESKVPFLGDIPLLGYLFKDKSVTKKQDEFVVIIKPHLVFDDAGQAQLTKQVGEKLGSEVGKELAPESYNMETKKAQN